MKSTPFWSLWGWPIAMAVLTTTGLVTALVSDSWGDWWSWVGLGVPVAVMAWHGWPRAPRTAAPRPHANCHPNADVTADAGTSPVADARTTPL